VWVGAVWVNALRVGAVLVGALRVDAVWVGAAWGFRFKTWGELGCGRRRCAGCGFRCGKEVNGCRLSSWGWDI